MLGYRSSDLSTHIKIDDLKMGHTAPANSRHWVAYVGMGYQ